MRGRQITGQLAWRSVFSATASIASNKRVGKDYVYPDME